MLKLQIDQRETAIEIRQAAARRIAACMACHSVVRVPKVWVFVVDGGPLCAVCVRPTMPGLPSILTDLNVALDRHQCSN